MATSKKRLTPTPSPTEATPSDAIAERPFEVEELDRELTAFLATTFAVPGAGSRTGNTVGAIKWGVYAFFDYDGEPIYVGQTKEKIGTRIRRHLSGRRSDAVAKNILDPYEVCKVRVYPLPQFQQTAASDKSAVATVDALEHAVFHKLLAESKFGAVLNEMDPPTPKLTVGIPEYVERQIASAEVMALRDHPDLRIARRAQTLAALAKGISERKVGLGIRRTLLTQAKRLQWLAERRLGQAPDEAEEGSDE
jgi:GIY-YIG catalytic domain